MAGVAFNEFGGAPPSIDDAAYVGRIFKLQNKDPNMTSFGDLSMQVRTAIETLGYDKNPAKRPIGVENAIIESLKDPMQAFYIVAKHLSDLRNIDSKGKKANELTDDDINVIGARYNRGGGLSLSSIKKNLSYGLAITKRKEKLEKLIKEDKPVKQ